MRALIVLAVLIACPCYAADEFHVPDRAFSPGAIATSDPAIVCNRQADGKTYSQDNRHTSQAVKNQVYREYHIAPNAHNTVEVDHIVPLAWGGRDVAENLWAQPIAEAHVKDLFEDAGSRLFCPQHGAPPKFPLSEMQADIMADWRAAYLKYMGHPPAMVDGAYSAGPAH